MHGSLHERGRLVLSVVGRRGYAVTCYVLVKCNGIVRRSTVYQVLCKFVAWRCVGFELCHVAGCGVKWCLRVPHN